jgi:hypothetical protein
MKRLLIVLISIGFIFVSGVALADNISNSNAGSLSSLNLTQESSEQKFNPIPQDLKFPQIIPYFGPDNPGFRFVPVHDILLYSKSFTIETLQKGIPQAMFDKYDLKRITDKDALDDIMTVIYDDQVNGANPNISREGYNLVGFIQAKAIDESTSVTALKVLLLIAHRMGADSVQVTRQGVDFSMEATGYGASIGGTSGTYSESGNSGSISAGMLGWAKGKSGAIKDPWLQGIALTNKSKRNVYKRIVTPEK